MPFAQTQIPSWSQWWKLPPEIRDIVYDHVYGRSDTVNISGHQFLRYKYLGGKKNRSKTPNVRPKAFIEPMLVSKKWFTEATRLVVARTHWFLHANNEWGSFLPDSYPYQLQPHAISRYMTKLSVRGSFLTDSKWWSLALNCSALKHLYVFVCAAQCDMDLENMFALDITANVITTEEVRRLRILEPWSTLRGLETVEVSFEFKEYYNWAAAALAILRQNARVFEEVLKKTATLPKDRSQVSNHLDESRPFTATSPPTSPFSTGFLVSENSTPLGDCDIPSSKSGMVRLMTTDVSRFAEWALGAKIRSAGYTKMKAQLKAMSED